MVGGVGVLCCGDVDKGMANPKSRCNRRGSFAIRRINLHGYNRALF